MHGRNCAGRARVVGRDIVAPVRPLPKGAYTVRWHALSADSHVVSGVWTFGVRVQAPPPTEAYGASGPTRTEHVVRWAYFVALALDDRLARLPARLPARADAAAARREAPLRRSPGSASSACSRSASSRSACAARTCCSCRSGSSSTATSRRSRADTRFGKAFVAMTLGFAFVAAFVYLAWLLDRPRAALAGARARRSASPSGLSLSGHDAVDPGSSWKTRARRLGAPLRRVALGRRARRARRRRLAGRAGAAARGVRALLATRGRAGRARARGRDLPERSCGCPPCPISGRSATGRCCS